MAKVTRKVAQNLAGTGKKRKAVKKPSKATQKGVKFSKGKDIVTGDESAVMSKVGTRGEKVTASPEPGFLKSQETKGSRKVAARKAELSALVRDGKATKSQKEELAGLRAKDRFDLEARNRRISSSLRGKTKEVDNFAVALRKAKETGELGEEFDKLTQNQQQKIIQSAKLTQNMKEPNQIAKEMLEKRNPTDKNIKVGNVILGTRKKDGMNKGGKVTKRAIGAHDYRMNKGGLLLSSVDNRKKN